MARFSVIKMQYVHVPLAGMCAAARPLMASLKSQGGGNPEVPHCDCLRLFSCCLKSVLGSFHYAR